MVSANHMPTFGSAAPLSQLWGKQVLDHALAVYLYEGDEVNDALLSMIESKSAVYITNAHGNRAPLRISCSPDAMGRVNPKSLCLMGRIEALEDSMFQNCSALEHIWFGASTRPLLESAPNLSRCPLKYMGFNGYGVVVRGHDLEQIANRVGQQGAGRVVTVF